MKIKHLIIALLPLSFVAQQAIAQTTTAAVSQQASSIATTLSQYAWTYQNVKASKPLVLHFTDFGHLSVETGCNELGANWKVEGNQLITTEVMGTKMGCQDALMQQELLAANLFNKAKSTVNISSNAGQPVLTITDSKGQKHVFYGKKALSLKELSAHTWSYKSANVSEPVILTFTNNETLSFTGGCNQHTTNLTVENGALVTSNIVSTKMGCPEADLAKQEQLMTNIFENRTVPVELNTDNANQPTLTVTDAQGRKYTFNSKASAETQYQSTARTVYLEVAPETKSCTGSTSSTCLQVREIKFEKGARTYVNKDWTLYSGQIQGFKHDPKARVILRVKRFDAKNAVKGQSKPKDILDLVIEREVVKR